MRLQWEVRPGRGAPGGLWGKQGSTGRVGRLRVSQDEQTSSKTQLSIQFQQEGWGSHLSVVSSLIVSDINNLVATKQCHCLSIFLFWIEKCQRLENSHYYPQGYFCFEWKKKKRENVTRGWFPDCVLRDLKRLVTCVLKAKASVPWYVR